VPVNTTINLTIVNLQGKLGELLVSLNYQPSVGVISVGVIKARTLKAKDINGLSGQTNSIPVK